MSDSGLLDCGRVGEGERARLQRRGLAELGKSGGAVGDAIVLPICRRSSASRLRSVWAGGLALVVVALRLAAGERVALGDWLRLVAALFVGEAQLRAE